MKLTSFSEVCSLAVRDGLTGSKTWTPWLFLSGLAVGCCLGVAACKRRLDPEPELASIHYVFTGAPWVQDAAGNWFLIDTGSPRTMVRPNVVGFPDGTLGEFKIRLAVNGLPRATHTILVTEDLPRRLLRAAKVGDIQSIGGIIGADSLSEFRFAIDPFDPQLHIGESRGTCGSSALPFSLEVERHGARLIVPIRIGGVSTYALVDTAATYVTVSRSLLPRLREAGPVSTLTIDTADGPGAESFARVSEVAVTTRGCADDAALPQVPLLVADPALMDAELARLQVETGRRVEALLGHSFLRRFITVVDMSAPAVELHPLPRQTLALDDFRTFGFLLSTSSDCWTVDSVIRESAVARAGLRPGDCVVAIGGVARTDLTSEQAGDPELFDTETVRLEVRRPTGNETFIVGTANQLPRAR